MIEDHEIDPHEFEKMKDTFQITEDLAVLMRNAKKYLKELSQSKKQQISKAFTEKIINEELSFIKSKIYDRIRIKLQNVTLYLKFRMIKLMKS